MICFRSENTVSCFASGIHDRLGQQVLQEQSKTYKDVQCEWLRNSLKSQFSKAEKQHRFPVEKGKKWLCKQNHLEEQANGYSVNSRTIAFAWLTKEKFSNKSRQKVFIWPTCEGPGNAT